METFTLAVYATEVKNAWSVEIVNEDLLTLFVMQSFSRCSCLKLMENSWMLTKPRQAQL